MPEQLVLEHVGRHGAAVEGDERLARPARLVDRTRHHLLAHAGFAGEEQVHGRDRKPPRARSRSFICSDRKIPGDGSSGLSMGHRASRSRASRRAAASARPQLASACTASQAVRAATVGATEATRSHSRSRQVPSGRAGGLARMRRRVPSTSVQRARSSHRGAISVSRDDSAQPTRRRTSSRARAPRCRAGWAARPAP